MQASEMMSKFLNWRLEKGVDDIRQQIVIGGKNRPELFPKGDIISRLVKSVILTPYNCDHDGHPIVVDQYDFNPNEVRELISMEDYILYVIFTLEYRALVCEQLSEEREQSFLETLSIENRARALYEPLSVGDNVVDVSLSAITQTLIRSTVSQQEEDERNEDIPPYGVTVMYVVIRDIGALGFDHIGSNGREIISAVISIASDNYPGKHINITSYVQNAT